MNFSDVSSLAFRTVRSNKLRTGLTVAIIAFGIMALIGIITAIKAMNQKFMESFSTMGANAFTVQTQTDDSGVTSNSYNFNTTANQWQEVTVTMAALGNPTAIKRINIQNNSSNSVIAYFDNIQLTTAATDTQAPTSPANLTVSNISQTGLTLTWTASTDNVGVVNYQVYRGTTLLNGTVTGTTYIVAGLACGTTYSFTVKAKDAAGNQSGSSNVVSATTSACGASTIVIYDETLNTDWNDWSWATTRNFSNTTPVQVGTKSAKVDYTAWGGLSLRKVSTTVNTTASTAVRFWLRTPTATTVKVYTSSTDTGGDASGYTFTTTANVWTEYIVSLAQLGNPTQIKRIHFQNYTANNVTAYFDNIRLVSVSGARAALEEEEELRQALNVFPNPSTGIVNVGYVAEKAEKVNVQVVGLSGLILQEREEQAVKGKNYFSLDLSTEKIGFYLIRLQNESKSKTSKVLIQR